jgi:predicted tellurium resistance membrane protein TerC
MIANILVLFFIALFMIFGCMVSWIVIQMFKSQRDESNKENDEKGNWS